MSPETRTARRRVESPIASRYPLARSAGPGPPITPKTACRAADIVARRSRSTGINTGTR